MPASNVLLMMLPGFGSSYAPSDARARGWVACIAKKINQNKYLQIFIVYICFMHTHRCVCEKNPLPPTTFVIPFVFVCLF